MKINIIDKANKLTVGQGDLLHDDFNNAMYIVTYDDYPDKFVRYKLVNMDGSGKVYNDKKYTVDDIKDLISKDGLIHYPRGVYVLELVKIKEKEDIGK